MFGLTRRDCIRKLRMTRFNWPVPGTIKTRNTCEMKPLKPALPDLSGTEARFRSGQILAIKNLALKCFKITLANAASEVGLESVLEQLNETC
ncbi:unnamed protein product [Brachionus calyciflorus]|uniref:Uncharacterized protein n=1 Tax=Brachionus calyciflorus TaxID=104777 RepID=A0A814KI54_9BILA|nr:unnamed protein product [Brachionus calyciflorus]